MNAKSLHQMQAAILDAVAPAGWRGMGITSATLQLTATGLPRLTLETCVPPSRMNPEPLTRLQEFELRPIEPARTRPAEPPALDLDRMTAEAMRRNKSDVANLALDAHVQIATQFTLARLASDKRCAEHLQTHRKELHAWAVRLGEKDSLQMLQGRWLFEISELAAISRAEFTKVNAGKKFHTGGLVTEPVRALPRLRAGERWITPIKCVAGAAVIALVLGTFGPALDAQPDRRSEWLQAEQELHNQGALAMWEAEARTRCARLGSENSTYVQVDGGAIVCTNKLGQALAQKGRP